MHVDQHPHISSSVQADEQRPAITVVEGGWVKSAENEYPGEVKIWSEVLLAATRHNGEQGAARVWSYARTLDQWVHGKATGGIERHHLFGWLRHLGLNERTRRRWISAAVSLNLFTIITRRSGEIIYRYLGVTAAAVTLGCTTVQRPAAIPAADLAGENWRSSVWAAHTTSLNGRPTSHRVKRIISGVPQTTQVRLEKKVPLKHAKNFAISEVSATHLAGYKECVRRHAFKFKTGKKLVLIGWRLPDAVHVPVTVARTLNKGQRRQVQKTLNAIQDAAVCSPRLQRLRYIMLQTHTRRASYAGVRSTLGAARSGDDGRAYVGRMYVGDERQAARRQAYLDRIGETDRETELYYCRPWEHRRGQNVSTMFWSPVVCGD